MTEAQRFIVLCREMICREIPVLVDGLFASLDVVLNDLADKVEGENPDDGYLEAIQIFRQRRIEIRSLFLDALLAAEDEVPIRRTTPEAEPAAAAPLPYWIPTRGGAELEESLAVANLISKAENRYRTELIALRHHLASLGRSEGGDGHTHPLGPYRLCTAFRRALSSVENLDLETRLIVYKLFDKQVMDQLGPVYTRCCERVARQTRTAGLTGQGICGSAERKPSARDGDEASRDGCGRNPSNGTVAFHDLQGLLERRGRIRTGGGAPGRVVDKVELLSLLSRLQQTAGTAVGRDSLHRRLREELAPGTEESSAGVLGPTESATLELVVLLFEHLLRDNEIPSPLATLIGYLEIPILRVALEDKSFFEDKHYPPRRLLNRLLRLAIGWSDDGDRSDSSLYGCIRRVVDRVLRHEEGDQVFFAELHAQLCDTSEGVRGTLLSRLDPEPERRTGHRTAPQLVRAAIDERLRDCGPLPEAITSLLYQGWHQVLLTAYLRDGTEGRGWQEGMAAIDHLLWSIRPKVSHEERRELLRGIPELQRVLRHSLSEVACDQRWLARWLKELQTLHIMALRGAKVEPGDPERRHPPAIGSTSRPGGAVLSAGNTPHRHTSGAAPSRETDLAAGAWVEVRREGGGLMRAKLAGFSPQSDVYLFVDRHGRKVMELVGEDILSLRRQGTLTVLGDTEIVDRAFCELVRALRCDQES